MGNISVDYDVLNQKGSPAWYSDLFANIPTPGYKGRMFISTDTFAFYRDNGVGWDLVGGPGTGTITGAGVSGQLTYFIGTDVISGNNNLFYDITNGRLGINTATPGSPLDIHSTGTAAQFNGTTTNNAFVFFQNAGTSKWRIGNLYNAGANDYQIYDVLNATARLTIKNTGATTLTGTFTATSLIKSGGTSSQILLADGSTTPTSTFGTGSVTNVSALTIGTTGVDLTSSVVNSTTTPVITLNVPTASATNRGALSSADWTTFNNKQATLSLTTTGTSGAATLVGATLNIPNYTNVGTVTSVAALTLGTTGTDLSSSVANSTSTPVITLNVPTASASNRGALSSADWTTFNSKQATISVTAPVVLTGATISMPAATTSVSGYLTSTDWNTFNNKTSNLGTVTDVVALTIGTTGIDITSTAVTTTTTPVITLNIPTASASNRGALSSTDWTTFNNKQATLSLTTTGTSGAATLIANTLNVPNYGSALSGYVPYTGATTNVNIGTNTFQSGKLTISTNDQSTNRLTLTNTGSGGRSYSIVGGLNAANNSSFSIYDETAASTRFEFTSTGAASFISTIQSRDTNGLALGSLPSYRRLQYDLATTTFGFLTDTNSNANIEVLRGTFSSTGGSGLRVYGGSGTHQWDMYLNGTNLRFSDNTSGGSFVVDTAATFSSSVGTTALNMNNMASLGSIGGGAIYLPYTAGLFFRSTDGSTAKGKIQADNSNNLLLNSDNAGSVLIGDTTASANLWVNNSGVGNTFGARNTNATFGATLSFLGADRNTTNNSFYYIDCYNYGSSSYRFRVADSGIVTATGYTFTGSGAVLQSNGSVGNVPQYGLFYNSGGVFYFGKDDGSGGSFGVGAYSTVLWNSNAYDIVLATNGTRRITLTGAGIFNATSRGNFLGATDNSLFSLNSGGTLYTVGFSPTATANSSNTLTLTTGQTTWIYTGSGTATWTLPNPSGTNQMFWIKNAGTGIITLNAYSGTNIINNAAASVSSITIAIGATALIQQDGNVKSYQLQ